ncbi:hypothetical protein [Pseudobacteriovorax antillogorgiicola]|uniref:Uncharacterized protein n=1 Tax=Pseudobacteriovorax antillogorgiicola TaxID=1513793 RepID=A0A1Y6BF04_9BACT|nr:hypothetical protein [Pseudobacteriovorax antillogorgiicola]TCS56263.1 hypothetical protein EDD56_10485 [Pseudobacteriovorax antillogorgiicola]SMF07847.1 hypothetical protein SAMN06296036_104248 [Pseudobacteriovorax antillogorgiicola]
MSTSKIATVGLGSALLILALIYKNERVEVGHQDTSLLPSTMTEPLAENTARVEPQPSSEKKASNRNEDPTKTDYFVFEPLPAKEEEAFVGEVEAMFMGSVRSLNDEQIRVTLANLNQRGHRGVASILQRLSHNPYDTHELSQRLALVDYLGYRMKFDPMTRFRVFEYLQQPIDHIKPAKVKAMKLNENIEVLKALARYDPDAAIAKLSAIKDPIYRSYAAVHIETGFLLAQMPKDQARQRIRDVYPSYDMPN